MSMSMPMPAPMAFASHSHNQLQSQSRPFSGASSASSQASFINHTFGHTQRPSSSNALASFPAPSISMPTPSPFASQHRPTSAFLGHPQPPSHSHSPSHSQPSRHPQPAQPPAFNLPEHNETLLSREMLLDLLRDLSARLQQVGRSVRLVVHGGAAMLLHPTLKSRRNSTRDVDVVARALSPEARKELEACVGATAARFGVGRDWMNAAADIALPMATDPTTGRQYDPIYQASVAQNNIALNTLYQSPGLTLIGAAPCWAVALKLVRYAKDDPADICALLRHGTRLNGVRWAPTVLEGWLRTECWPMGYSGYPREQVQKMREKIEHAVRQAYADAGYVSSEGARQDHAGRMEMVR